MKKIAISLALLASPFVLVFAWFFAIFPDLPNLQQLQRVKPEQLAYLNKALPAKRGTILIVLASSEKIEKSGMEAGYEFTELARPYWVFTVNGFDVDIASITGGEPPAVFDNDDMREFDYAFLNDTEAMAKLRQSIPIDRVNADDYEAVYFAGGKGAMVDFPENADIQTLVRQLYQAGKVIAAVCHGPAAFVGVTLDDGRPLVSGKRVTGFTNEEELFLIPDAEKSFPFLLQDALIADGAKFEEGVMYLEQVSVDENVVTGQNPWSTWAAAEAVVLALGYELVARTPTPTENSVELLEQYHSGGFIAAREAIQQNPEREYDQVLIAVHTLVAGMRIAPVDVVQLLRIGTAIP